MNSIKNLLDSDPVKRSRILLLIILDVGCVALSGYLALEMRFNIIPAPIEPEFLASYLDYLPWHILTVILLYYMFHIYHSLWEYAGFRECQNIVVACIIAAVVQIAGMKIADYPVPVSFYYLGNASMAILTMLTRLSYRKLRLIRQKKMGAGTSSVKHVQAVRKPENVMIIGAGQSCIMLIKEIRTSRFLNRKVCCIIDDDPLKTGKFIQGVRIEGTRNDIVRLAGEMDIDQIIIAMPSVSKLVVREIIEICQKTSCELLTLPGLYQIIRGDVNISSLRKVEIEDLLGREPVVLDNELVDASVRDKVIMVTGGGGSIGSELCRQLAEKNVKELIIVDIYENNAYNIEQELKRSHPGLNLRVLIASVRDSHRMRQIFEKHHPDIIYHAAAHKHVPLMENSPNEAIKNNVGGTLNMVRLADEFRVERFVLISTDKAVNPTNIMGATKRICEMIIQTYAHRSSTEYVAVRFGNVLGSNGSVIPLFKQQISEGGPVTVTHPDIIRYFMMIPEAVALVLQAGAYAKGGEIFVLDMGEPVRIYDLACKLIRLEGFIPGEDIEIVFTGLRPGEKLYEELLMNEEGLQDTPNKLIHIGKPIQLDEEHFFPQVERLLKEAYEDGDHIREAVKNLVDTYKPMEE